MLLVVHADADDGCGAGEFGGADHVFSGFVVHDAVFAVDDDEVESGPTHEFDQCGSGPTDERAESGSAVEHLSLHGVVSHGESLSRKGWSDFQSRCFRLIQIVEIGDVTPDVFGNLFGVSCGVDLDPTVRFVVGKFTVATSDAAVETDREFLEAALGFSG